MTSSQNMQLQCSEFFALTTSALRYALGRRTYVADETANIIKGHFHELNTSQQRCLINDVSDWLHTMNPAHQFKSDLKVWDDLFAWMTNPVNYT